MSAMENFLPAPAIIFAAPCLLLRVARTGSLNGIAFWALMIIVWIAGVELVPCRWAEPLGRANLVPLQIVLTMAGGDRWKALARKFLWCRSLSGIP